MSSGEWRLSQGPERPLWEPVRLVDFSGKRLEALQELRADLLAKRERGPLDDEDLAMHVILERLFTQATVMIAFVTPETRRLATLQLPQPAKGRRKLSASRLDELVLVVGRTWQIFTSHNFPLPPKTQPEA